MTRHLKAATSAKEMEYIGILRSCIKQYPSQPARRVSNEHYDLRRVFEA